MNIILKVIKIIKMNDVYWIYEDKFIFKPEFNESIDKYVDVIKNYSQLIFSDYDNLQIFIKINNKYLPKYDKNYKESKFNHLLIKTLISLTSLKHLTFSNLYDKLLSNSLDNLTSLTHLTFGRVFNQPLLNSLNNLICLTHLTFGYNFNKPLEESLNNLSSLTHLTFGYNFNQLPIKFL